MNIKKPPKNTKCSVCGVEPTIQSMQDSQIISECVRGPSGVVEGGKQTSLGVNTPISDELNISCTDYQEIRSNSEQHVLLDVRVKRQFEMCSLDGAINIPFADLAEKLNQVEELSGGIKPVYCVCRRGILSNKATLVLVEAASNHPRIHSVRNISGGLQAWANEVDSSFPTY